MNDKINALISEMTLEEKANILSGKDFWHTEAVNRLGIPEIMVADGPAGLRKQETINGALTTVPCTCFPSESLLACSWDIDLMEGFG